MRVLHVFIYFCFLGGFFVLFFFWLRRITVSALELVSLKISKVTKNFWCPVEQKMFNITWPFFLILYLKKGRSPKIRGEIESKIFWKKICFSQPIYYDKAKKRNCSTCWSKDHRAIILVFCYVTRGPKDFKIF